MGRIADVLKEKGSTVHSIGVDATVFEAIEKMVGANVGSLLVKDGERICGIVTERDYLRRVALAGRTSKTTAVREIMTAEVYVVPPESEVEECMALMTGRRIRHVPVVSGGRILGVVSIGDLVRHVSREHHFHVQVLTDYITGKYPA